MDYNQNTNPKWIIDKPENSVCELYWINCKLKLITYHVYDSSINDFKDINIYFPPKNKFNIVKESSL